jgi:SAM-dependent methyltransferase
MTELGFVRDTRASYDEAAASYASQFGGELAARPLDRALLAGFAELASAAGAPPVADIGCGPGRVTAFLHELGLPAFGIDLSPQMVAQARQAYPGLRFEVGSMLALDLPDCSLSGIAAWYSIIHLPDDQLPRAFAEFFRVLVPGGHLLLAFQVGSEVRHLADMAGHDVSLDFHRRQPEQITEALSRAGLEVRARVLREPDSGEFPEHTQQAYVLSRRPPATDPA